VSLIIGGFYFIVPSLPSLLTPCLFAFALWFVLTGANLYQLGRLPAGR
jgi:hypothetical protein